MSVQNIQIVVNLGHTEWTTVAPASGQYAFAPTAGTADLHSSVRAALRRMLGDMGIALVEVLVDAKRDEWNHYRVETGTLRTIHVAARWTDKTHVEI
jgi:hypothetical protein